MILGTAESGISCCSPTEGRRTSPDYLALPWAATASLGPDTSKGTNIKQIVFTPSGDLLAVSDRGIIRHSYDTVWNFTLHNYYPSAPSLQDPSRDAEQIQIISPNEMLVGWNGMLVNVGEPTAGLGHTQVNNAHWGIDVWSGGGFPTAFNILAEHPPGTRLFADLYGLKVSNDSGMTWNPYPNSPHLWNSHFLSIDRSNRYLYSTNTAGLISFDLTTGGTDTLFPMDVVGRPHGRQTGELIHSAARCASSLPPSDA